MSEKWINLDLGDDYHVSVRVNGAPFDSGDELRAMATRKLALRLERERMVPRLPANP